SAEGKVLRAQQREDGRQIIDGGLQLFVGGDVQRRLGGVRLRRRGRRGFGALGRRGFGGGRGRGGRGGRFRRGGRGLGGRGRGGFGLLHRHPDLGRDALEQAAGRELQHFVADAQIVAVDAQRAAGGLDSLLHGLGGHFDLTHGDFLPYLPRWGLSLFRRGPG